MEFVLKGAGFGGFTAGDVFGINDDAAGTFAAIAPGSDAPIHPMLGSIGRNETIVKAGKIFTGETPAVEILPAFGKVGEAIVMISAEHGFAR